MSFEGYISCPLKEKTEGKAYMNKSREEQRSMVFSKGGGGHWRVVSPEAFVGGVRSQHLVGGGILRCCLSFLGQ